jgi:hypothetical protein
MNIQIQVGAPVTPVTTIALVNNTAKTQALAVPAKTIWRVMAIGIMNGDNVARNATVHVRNQAGIMIVSLLENTAIPAGTSVSFPNAAFPWSALILDSLWDIYVAFATGGASAGGTGYVNIIADSWGKH